MRIYEIENYKGKRRTEKSDRVNLKKESPIAYKFERLHGIIPLYRGIRAKTDKVLYGDSSSGQARISANTKNFYTILIDEMLPSWKGYPKRSRSWVCSSDRYTAEAYGYDRGSLYEVYPVGDPMIAICPAVDMWDSFKSQPMNIFHGLSTFNRYLERDIHYILKGRVIHIGENKESIEQLIDDVNKTGKEKLLDKINEVRDYPEDEPFLHAYIKSNFDDFGKFLDFAMDPRRNNFTIMKFSEYLDNYDKFRDREMWFSGPSYFSMVR